jgi:ankyrin repeat protein
LLNSDFALHSGGDDSDSECSEQSLTLEEESKKTVKNGKKASKPGKSSKRPAEPVPRRPKKRVRLRRMYSCCEFIALHSALEGGANAHVLRHVLDLFPDQVTKKDCSGRLPLHVAMAHCHGEETVDLILDKILKPYPDAATVQDESGRLPLHVGLFKRADFRLIEALVEANPASGFTPCGQSNKLPVHIAMENNCDLSTLYALLRGDPCVISDLVDSC